MNSISGKIVLDQNGIGIPNLLVVLYDVDFRTPSEEDAPGTPADPRDTIANIAVAPESNAVMAFMNRLGDRLGSVLTAADGSFSLEYEDAEFQIRNSEKRPDLLLLVEGPQAPGKTLGDLVVFVSPEFRQNAGKTEMYFIQLTAEQLQKAGLPVPQSASSSTITPDDDIAENELKGLERRLEIAEKFNSRKASILLTHIGEKHEKHADERASIFSDNVKKELSSVSKAVQDRFFVGEGEDIGKKWFDSVGTQVSQLFNSEPTPSKPVSKGFIYLTQAEIVRYKESIQGDEFVLPGSVVEQEILPKLFRGNTEDGTANDFLMNHPTVRLCLGDIREDIGCKPISQPENDAPIILAPTPNGETTPLAPATPEDINLFIARQLEHAAAPEGLVNFGVDAKDRATAGDIGQTIGQLQFAKGPADTPAFYDFHTLKIAFEHVWKEAIDLGLLAKSEELYDESAGTGKRPNKLLDAISTTVSTVRFAESNRQTGIVDPPVEVVFEFPDAVGIWEKMTPNEQKVLMKLSQILLVEYNEDTSWANFVIGTASGVPDIPEEPEKFGNPVKLDGMNMIRQRGQRILDKVNEREEEKKELATDTARFKRAAELAESLQKQLKERYSFTYFAADGSLGRSVNFGVLLTYRQKWDPVGYQAGELVKTIPLAPKEVRKYSKKTVVKKNRTQKEIEDNLRITKTDTSDTSRAESEIINKVFNKNTFSLNTVSQFDIPLSEGAKIGNTVTTNMTDDAQRDSNQTKKDFRESVIKAAQEYKNERRTEITTESFYESETTESGEISNPNDELTVTYLFYELQRQFRVDERLHRMRPVVLVAQEMPAPHEIDDAWIVRYDWILRRALLDDSFQYAIDCVMHIRGEQLLLEELERTVFDQRKIVRELRQNVKFFTDETERMSRLMQAAINREADIVEGGRNGLGDIALGLLGGAAVTGVSKLLGMGKDDDAKEAARIRREAIKDTYVRSEEVRREQMARLEQEIGVLTSLTKQLAEKRKEINEKEVLIARLENHLKDNILYYMQAIWSYEYPDQRFFRLFNTRVPVLTAKPEEYNFRIQREPSPDAALDAVVNIGREKDEIKTRHAYSFTPVVSVEEKTLEEVAELDTLLGFKGNYMIFPMRKSNVLTDFMMAPYVDSEFGLLDPDALGNWTLEEFEQLFCCLKTQLGDRFSEVEADLKKFYKQLLLDPLRPGELITVPTGSLFIEALPGTYPMIENFKLLHRAVDVKKVQAEVRKLELENARYAERILKGELDDPDTEKKVIIDKAGTTIVEPN